SNDVICICCSGGVRPLHTFSQVKGSDPFTELHTALVPARRRRAAPSITPGSGFLPVHHSNCLSAWATSIARPSSVARPARRALRTSVASPGPYVRSYTSRPVSLSAGIGDSERRAAPPSGVQLTSRSHDPD